MTNSRVIDARTLKVLILAAFFLSGVSALIYQVVWMRMLTLTFGATVFAVSAVLSAFMAGLALGAWAFGRFSDRVKRPVLLYVLLELGIGAYALLTPWLFQHIDTVYAPLLRGLTDDFYLLSLIRFVLAFAVIAVGAAFMGGTLPVLSRFYVHSAGEVGKGVGTLYALNTFGAVLGVIVSGFILIPLAGVSATLHSAVFINLFIGIGLALVVWRSVPATLVSKPETAVAGDPRARWVLIAFAVSGFAALAYEVIWTRVLSLVIGSSTYAFSIMLLTFLLGLALGSAIMSRYLPRLAGREYLGFALIQIGIAVTVLLAVAFTDTLPLLFLFLAQHMPPNFIGILTMQVGLSLLVMLPPTLLLGALFPLVCRMYAGSIGTLGARVGYLYAANTAGAILGAFMAGFVLIPLLGSEKSLLAVIWLNAAIGAGFLVFFAELIKRNKILVLASGMLLFPVLGLNIPPWDMLAMNSNFPQILKTIVEKPSLLEKYLDNEVIYADEDVSGHVLVFRKEDGSLNLHAGGHAEGGSHEADMPVQVELAAIPALMHDKPEKVLVIGLGPGITLGAIEQMEGVKEIDVVEISTGVVKASEVFAEVNHNALEDDRVNLIVDDARHYLAHSENKYDLIIIGPSYVWVSGTANLFTVEFFRLVKEHMEPGALVTLWFQLYNITVPHIKMFTASVNEVFPHTSLWLSSTYAEMIMVGSAEPHAFDYMSLVHRLETPVISNEVKRALPPFADSVLSLFLMGDKEVERYVSKAPLNTDDHPLLEFEAPRYLYNWDFLQNLESLFGESRAVDIPVANLSYRKDETVFYPFMRIKVTDSGWQTEGSYLNSTRFYSEGLGGKRPLRVMTPLMRFNSGGYLFELRGSSRQALDADGLKTMVASISGLKPSDVHISEFDGQPLYWAKVRGNGPEAYVMTWQCTTNGMQYFGRLQGSISGNAKFENILIELDGKIHCYTPQHQRFPDT